MARADNGHWAVMLLATAALGACVEGGGKLGKAEGGAAPVLPDLTATSPSGSTQISDRDVEAPEVFQITAKGLWDGRPSLGGVWVATPDAKDPERVMIRNTANGKSVIGALFRRERENPGPPVQISSDAAEALGLLAGQPADVKVTALRREQPAAPKPAATESATATADAGSKKPLDTTAVAAAIDKSDPAAATKAGTTAAAAKTGVATTAKPGAPAKPVAGTATATASAEPLVTAEPAKRKWWQRKDKAAPVAAGPAAEATAGAKTATAASPLVTAAPLAAPKAEAAVPATTAPAPSSGGKSLIQLGIFSVEANAKRAADMVTKAGAPAEVRAEKSNGKPYWSVVAGPATTPAGRDALMTKVKGLGFKDAYFTSR